MHEGFLRINNITAVPWGVLNQSRAHIIGRLNGGEVASLLQAIADFVTIFDTAPGRL